MKEGVRVDSNGIDRIIRLDLGVTSTHSAVVLDARDQILARRRVSSTVAGLVELGSGCERPTQVAR